MNEIGLAGHNFHSIIRRNKFIIKRINSDYRQPLEYVSRNLYTIALPYSHELSWSFTERYKIWKNGLLNCKQ